MNDFHNSASATGFSEGPLQWVTEQIAPQEIHLADAPVNTGAAVGNEYGRDPLPWLAAAFHGQTSAVVITDKALQVVAMTPAASELLAQLDGIIQDGEPLSSVDLSAVIPASALNLGVETNHTLTSVKGAPVAVQITAFEDPASGCSGYRVNFSKTSDLDGRDQTAELIERIECLLPGANEDCVQTRLETADLHGSARHIAVAINKLIDRQATVTALIAEWLQIFADPPVDLAIPTLGRGFEPLSSAMEVAATSVAKRGNGAAGPDHDLARLLEELDVMRSEHALGNIDHKLDAGSYPDDLSVVATRLNEMVFGHIATTRMVVDQLHYFCDGIFEMPFPALPRKKAFVSSGVEALRLNLKGMLAEITRTTDAICEGRLNVDDVGTDFKGDFSSITKSMSRLVDRLNSVFRALGVEVGQTSAAVEQMSSAARELATNSQVQSASVDEVSASAEETDTQVKSNAAAAGQANQLVTGAAAVAEEGKEKIGQMVQAMEGIRASSQDIAKIIKVIDEIAFQTNLLALNAAVEAARAGQHGRGFAVVAQEVRNLAGRSAKAARETGELIESAGARVQAGVKIADEASRAFASIAGDIDQVRSFMREIAVASDEQARGVAQINTAISEVAKTALVTSQQAEEVAARVAEMEQASERMHREVSRFQLRAQPAAVELPTLDSLPPDIAAQVLALMKARTAPTPKETHPSHRSPDRDERGFKGF